MNDKMVTFGAHGAFEISDPILLERVPAGDPTVNLYCEAPSRNEVCANLNPTCGSDIVCDVGTPGIPGTPGVPNVPRPRPNMPNGACGPLAAC
ncbi:MAG TPA: hypothetical protein VM240_12700 [Verrucomicrobiae bacterium]|nr:hypothetical protein [Verrucomicrobiae bacterium]